MTAPLLVDVGRVLLGAGVLLSVRLVWGFTGDFYGFAQGLMASQGTQFG
ncbi:hypothetical protein ABH935_004035 [Catenulispora sp. GAS73]